MTRRYSRIRPGSQRASGTCHGHCQSVECDPDVWSGRPLCQHHSRVGQGLGRTIQLAVGGPAAFAKRRYRIFDGAPDQSGLAPENFTTLAHFSVSSAMSFPKSAAEPGSAVPPRSASCALSLGLARPASISLLSFSTISTGVFLGTPTPYHWLAS